MTTCLGIAGYGLRPLLVIRNDRFARGYVRLRSCFVRVLDLCSTQTMGKTTKEDLGGDVRISYPPLILSTSELTKTNVRSRRRFVAG